MIKTLIRERLHLQVDDKEVRLHFTTQDELRVSISLSAPGKEQRGTWPVIVTWAEQYANAVNSKSKASEAISAKLSVKRNSPAPKLNEIEQPASPAMKAREKPSIASQKIMISREKAHPLQARGVGRTKKLSPDKYIVKDLTFHSVREEVMAIFENDSYMVFAGKTNYDKAYQCCEQLSPAGASDLCLLVAGSLVRLHVKPNVKILVIGD